jgi:hypothetical protein
LLKNGVSAPSIKGELITSKELVTDRLAFFQNVN